MGGRPALALFDPIVRRWFSERVGEPTQIQEAAWPRIAAGEHVLASAPTGSGKTLTAFLWALDRLLTGSWRGGTLRVLYVSPLKALNNDIRRNLLTPLAQLRERFDSSGRGAAPLAVNTRSGDTPASERRRMERHPPEILITTPESLNLLLSTRGGQQMFRTLACVVLDEIHSILDNKRGTHLITAVERLVPLAGEFQRIALSATVEPPELAAEFVGGFLPSDDPITRPGAARSVTVLCSNMAKRYDVEVLFPANERGSDRNETIWDPLVAELKRRIHANRSTLIFVNGRRMCEKITRLINTDEERLLAYAHHGSLSREIRLEVEERLKAGELKAIVATSSLELGIDIGSLDEVLMLQAPSSIASAIQRAGRAGHGVGEVSRATLIPTTSRDLLNSAVLAAEIQARGIERTVPVRAPLDVLAQVVVSMCATEHRSVDALFSTLRASYPYRELPRELFDLVLKMLAGRYSDARIRDLRPRISLDGVDGTARTNRSGLAALFLSGGTIPDRGYFQLRRQDSGALVGELDEEFVWEAKVGDRFTLGAQQWRIERITHNDVFVVPAPSRLKDLPFWRAEDSARSHHFSARIAELLERADAALGEPAFETELRERFALDCDARDALIGYLEEQHAASGASLPHRHHLLVERVDAGPAGAPGQQLVLHTLWGGRVNRPYALALESAWKERYGADLEIFCDDDCVVLQLPGDLAVDDVLSLVTSTSYEKHLRRRLESTGLFGARFREAAGRALLVTRRKFSERLPLWMSRLRSQKLLESVREFEDFPLLLEAWRSCLEEEFELPALERMLLELESGSISVTEIRSAAASPMARSSSFKQINTYMYRDDQPRGDGRSRLRSDLIDQLLFDAQLRPDLPAALCARFEDKRRRLFAGYAVRDPDELLDWVKERGLVPLEEWERMLALAASELGLSPTEIERELVGPVRTKVCRLRAARAASDLLVALEVRNRWVPALYEDAGEVVRIELLSGSALEGGEGSGEQSVAFDRDPPELSDLLREWLEFYGPRPVAFVEQTLGIEAERLAEAVRELANARQLVFGQLLADAPADEQLCDARNFEMLLRIARAEAVPNVEPLPAEELAPFMAQQQGLIRRERERDGLGRVLDRLCCLALPAKLWESDVLTVRVEHYRPEWLDSTLRESDLLWVGDAARSVGFVFESDLDLWFDESAAAAEPVGDAGEDARSLTPNDGGGSIESLFRDPLSRYDFGTLQRSSGCASHRLERMLWEGAFAGAVTSDGFDAVRRGIERKFEPLEIAAASEPTAATRARGGRRRRARWKARTGLPGSWRLVPRAALDDDPLEREERNRERVRLLLERHGILFRELLEHEAPPFRWPRLFSTLRLMELSGEIVSGCFFDGIPGPQFISQLALRGLLARPWKDAVFWLNAADPASPCGLKLLGLPEALPRRVPSTHLTYHGAKLVLVSQRNGRELDFRVPPDTERLPDYLGVLRHLMTRPTGRIRQLLIERINDEPAPGSPYLDALRLQFDLFLEPKLVVLGGR
jgi:ATP-dependent Lhr-like helicase